LNFKKVASHDGQHRCVVGHFPSLSRSDRFTASRSQVGKPTSKQAFSLVWHTGVQNQVTSSQAL
jgi:hypothetical protein